MSFFQGLRKLPPTPHHLAYRLGRTCVQTVSVWCLVCVQLAHCFSQVMNTNLEVNRVLLVSKVVVVLGPDGGRGGIVILENTSPYHSRL